MYHYQARRHGGFEGVRSNPPFGLSPKDFIHRLATIYFLSALSFASGPLASLPLRITAFQTSSVAGKLIIMHPAERTHVSELRCCVEWTRINTYVNTCANKSLFQASSLLVGHCCNSSANCSTFSPRNSMSTGLANAY